MPTTPVPSSHGAKTLATLSVRGFVVPGSRMSRLGSAVLSITTPGRPNVSASHDSKRSRTIPSATRTQTWAPRPESTTEARSPSASNTSNATAKQASRLASVSSTGSTSTSSTRARRTSESRGFTCADALSALPQSQTCRGPNRLSTHAAACSTSVKIRPA